MESFRNELCHSGALLHSLSSATFSVAGLVHNRSVENFIHEQFRIECRFWVPVFRRIWNFSRNVSTDQGWWSSELTPPNDSSDDYLLDVWDGSEWLPFEFGASATRLIFKRRTSLALERRILSESLINWRASRRVFQSDSSRTNLSGITTVRDPDIELGSSALGNDNRSLPIRGSSRRDTAARLLLIRDPCKI